MHDKQSRHGKDLVLDLIRLDSNKKIKNKSVDDIVYSQAAPNIRGD